MDGGEAALQEWVFKNTLVFLGQVRVCLTG